MNAAQRCGHWRTARQGLFDALDLLEDNQFSFTPREGL
jgi:hypothetical protein